MSPVAQSKRRSCSPKYPIRATPKLPQTQIQDICPRLSTSVTRKPNQPQAIQPQKHRCPPIRPLSRGKGGHHRKGKSIEPCRGGNVSATNSTLPSNLAALPLQYTARMSTRYGGAVTRRQRLRRPNPHGTAKGTKNKKRAALRPQGRIASTLSKQRPNADSGNSDSTSFHPAGQQPTQPIYRPPVP